MSLAGGCACGAIRYECAGAPLAMVTCHCRDCQRAGGSAYAPTIVVSRAGLRIVRGAPAVHERAADSGNLARREFCRDCGSPLFASSSARPERVGIRAGSLDDPSSFRPTRVVFSASAQPWDACAKGQ
ncbi:MAG TPA: GFA family protein [Myxococcota bacterium]|nr:GFA family protein [Myxococcota bacterium]